MQTSIALPVSQRRGVVPDEIAGDLVQPLVGGDDVVVALEFLLQALLDIDVRAVSSSSSFCGDPFVQVADRHAELVAAGVVVQRHRGLVLDRPLEVVGGDVIAEHPPGDLVVLEQRRAGKADVAGVRQGVAHVQRQRAVLRAVRLVGDDDDVVALRIALFWIHVLVELLDQREDVRLVLRQQPARGARRSAARHGSLSLSTTPQPAKVL